MPGRNPLAAYRNYLIVLGVALLIFALDFFRLIDFRERDAISLRFLLRGPQRAHSDIIIVEVDNASMETFGPWPWPRSVHAVLLKILTEYEPKLVFFDMLFTEPSRGPGEDDSFAFAIEKSGRVLLPFFYYAETPFRAFFPIEPLLESAKATGFANIAPDSDGQVRRVRLSINGEDGAYYHASVAMVLSQFVDQEKAEEWLQRVPVDENQNFWVNYPGPLPSFTRIPYRNVINLAEPEHQEKMKKFFKDKYVLVGHTATGSTDLRTTPFSTVYPGVALQASSLHTLLTGKFLRSVPVGFHLLMVLGFSLLVAWLTRVAGPKKGFFFSLVILIFYSLWNFLVFCFAGVILPFFVPLVAMIVTYVLMLFLEYTEIRFQGELIGRELSTAARIQENFLPQTQPKNEFLDVSFDCRFAKQVGGDLYDWIDLGEGRLGICVGDVSGKGVPAAIYMARAISDFRRENKTGLPAAEVCTAMNSLLARDGTSGMFLTMIYAIADSKQKKISFANAGHEPMIFYRAEKKKAEIVNGASGRPLGLFMEGEYEAVEIPFQEGDVFVLLTDGVKELRNPRGQELGLERICQHVQEFAAGHTAGEMVKHLFNVMRDYRKSVPPHDDRTLVCVKFNAPF